MSCLNYLLNRGVTRLCHFTKLKDLTHILLSDDGIVSSIAIRPDVKDQKDPERYDGELDYVCCSIEYPNSWYLRRAQQRDADHVFRDWVTIYIDLDILNYRDVKFCPCNAATHCGAHILSDKSKICDLYSSPNVVNRVRSPKMLQCCPTDDQSEILIRDNIPYSFFSGIAVCNETVAQQVYSIIRTCEKKPLPIYIAPDVLNTNWSSSIRAGIRPEETKLTVKEELA